MEIKYYKNNNITYASRKRYRNLPSLTPINSETQKSVLLGDGARTSVKTSVENICDYVTIDDTRWFVTDYIYLNGKQIQLNLQRDVVGEFGVDTCYGKVERGFTNTILKYRKELSLNEVLKKRIPLRPSEDVYGNFSVNTHEKEMWGILYFTKDSKANKVNINIPAFSPSYEIATAIPDNSTYKLREVSRVQQEFLVSVQNVTEYSYLFNCKITYKYNLNSWEVDDVSANLLDPSSGSAFIDFTPTFIFRSSTNNTSYNRALDVATRICKNIIGARTIQNRLNGFSFPSFSDIAISDVDYTGKIIKDGEHYYSYSSTVTVNDTDYVGYTNNNLFYDSVGEIGAVSVDNITYNIIKGNIKNLKLKSYEEVTLIDYKRTELSPSEAGAITIDMNTQLVDEPYSILAFPLYDVTIKDIETDETYVIEKDNAFMVFNEVIQGLSGENGFIVDAQIYPYCPDLVRKQTELIVDGVGYYPFFAIRSTTFNRICEVQLLPYNDVKKEYIVRNYSIVSPEQSSKFTFNYYDYVNEFVGDGEFNNSTMKIVIKTALKPFAIISSAVIQRVNSLKGENYASNLEGSQPSSNGFECSLSSDAFETYKRQNSNYQNIFALDKEELQKQHTVERVNEATQGILNTLSMTAFGAIAGGAMADYSFMGINARGAGATIGAATFGATVGAANAAQFGANEYIRQYEEQLQQRRFDLNIGTIKNLPNSVNRISSFNEIIMQDFYFVIEVYECTDIEKSIVDNFIEQYAYGIGVYDFVVNYIKDGWFVRADIIKSNLTINLHEIAARELAGGIYLYE